MTALNKKCKKQSGSVSLASETLKPDTSCKDIENMSDVEYMERSVTTTISREWRNVGGFTFLNKLNECLHCDSDGWVKWITLDQQLVWGACAECNDDMLKPKPDE